MIASLFNYREKYANMICAGRMQYIPMHSTDFTRCKNGSRLINAQSEAFYSKHCHAICFLCADFSADFRESIPMSWQTFQIDNAA